ncbi:MAG: tetratricopeptide repeat protein, partial [Gemmatimonadota bacterium]
MLKSKVLTLRHFRGRRSRRRAETFALHLPDLHRTNVLDHLWSALEITAADRAAAVWVDEYGPGLVHPHVVLDVGCDPPRLDFSLELVHRTWQQGVPGLVDIPDGDRSPGPGLAAGVGSAFAVSLGSDGLRAWFVVVDSPSARPRLAVDVVEELLFLSGECAGILLHRDMDGASGPDGSERDGRFAAWPVLRDAPDRDVADDDNRRIACRFVVARAARALIQEDLVIGRSDLEERIAGVRNELRRLDEDDEEVASWESILGALERGDHPGLADTLYASARIAENRGHWHGAGELYRAARDVAAVAGVVGRGLDATRALGRTFRRLGEWDEASRWYGLAREAAHRLDDTAREARAVDGLATVRISRGDLPGARELLTAAVPMARAGGDPDAVGAVLHSLMTVAHTEGRLEDALRHGWEAVTSYEDEGGRLEALTALGGVFLEGRDLPAAEDAFQIVVSQGRDRVYRLYAVAGLALVSAHRRDAVEFRTRLADLDAAGFGDGPPELRAEVLLECGDGFLVLGDESEARRFYGRAATVAEEHGVSEYLIRAEEAIARLARRDEMERREAAADVPVLDREDLRNIRGGLGRMRREVAG